MRQIAAEYRMSCGRLLAMRPPIAVPPARRHGLLWIEIVWASRAAGRIRPDALAAGSRAVPECHDMTALPPIATVLALGAGQIVAYASSFYLLGTLGDPICRDLGLSPAFVFGLMSAALLVSAFAGPSVGHLLDRCGGRDVLLASNVVFAAALGLLSLAGGAAGLTIGMLVLGAGMAIGLTSTLFRILVGLHGDQARRPIAGVAL